MMRRFAFLTLLALLPFAGCSSSPASSASSSSSSSSGQPPPPKSFDVPDRQPGVRAPLTAACGDMDTARCLLPWPSSTFSVADKSTATGIRVQVDPSSLIAPDDPTTINLADGFSRVTPLVTAFEANVGTLPTGAEGSIRLILAQPGAPGFASSVPLRFDVESTQILGESPESFVFGYPLRPLAADSDYVGVVLDDLPTSGGTKPPPPAPPRSRSGSSPPPRWPRPSSRRTTRPPAPCWRRPASTRTTS